MAERRMESVKLEGVKIVFRNLAGEPNQYNKDGKRSFAVVLPGDIADDMEKDGWNVKRKPPREEGDPEFCFVNVKVSYDVKKPTIVMIVNNVRTPLTENNVRLLDYANIDYVDLIINPFRWRRTDGSSGVAAYLQTMFVVVKVDDLELKYADIPESEYEAEDMIGSDEIPY